MDEKKHKYLPNASKYEAKKWLKETFNIMNAEDFYQFSEMMGPDVMMLVKNVLYSKRLEKKHKYDRDKDLNTKPIEWFAKELAKEMGRANDTVFIAEMCSKHTKKELFRMIKKIVFKDYPGGSYA